MDTEMMTDAELLAKVKAFCEERGVKPTTFGREALGDGMLIANLEAGRSLTLRNANRLLDFMANYAPTESVAA